MAISQPPFKAQETVAKIPLNIFATSDLLTALSLLDDFFFCFDPMGPTLLNWGKTFISMFALINVVQSGQTLMANNSGLRDRD